MIVIRMQVDDPSAQLPDTLPAWRLVFLFAHALGRIMEAQCFTSLGPLASRRNRARSVTGDITRSRRPLGKCRFSLGMRSSGRMRLKHNSMSALGETQGKILGCLAAIDDPFHPWPQNGSAAVQLQLDSQSGPPRANCSVDRLARQIPPAWLRSLAATGDIFQGLGQIKSFERVVELDREARPR